MPESVKDRPTRSHEYVFMFTKAHQYTYHHEAVKERAENRDMRNRRTVWNINTAGSGGTHIAAFPEALVEPCVLAATVPGDFVLDPFFGSGTVGIVSRRLDRQYVGIELNPAYVAEAIAALRKPVSATRRNGCNYKITDDELTPSLLETPGDCRIES